MPVTDDELIELHKTIRLAKVTKSCPNCDTDHYLEYLDTEIKCQCGTIVKFRRNEMLYIIRKGTCFNIALRPSDE